MNAHLRANLWLLGVTALLCCALYPLTLLVIGRGLFPDKAAGSLLFENGKAIGSRLIAQPFTSDEYFQPRPSAASYNASASAGSNYGANNPKLRYRVAQALGPIVMYRSGPKKDQLAGPDIEKWFQQDQFKGQPHILAQWAETYSSAAQDWVKADKLNSEYVSAWQAAHPKEVEEWLRKNEISEPKPEDLAVPFFTSFSHTFPGTWPGAVEKKLADGKTVKCIEPVTQDTNIQANFFDMWLQEHREVELKEVPADRVMASGSGLDPHITLMNARYQLDRVADAWVKKTGRDATEIRTEIENLLKQKASAPFGGLAGVKLINVLEVNLELRDRITNSSKLAKGNGGSGSGSCGGDEQEVSLFFLSFHCQRCRSWPCDYKEWKDADPKKMGKTRDEPANRPSVHASLRLHTVADFSTTFPPRHGYGNGPAVSAIHASARGSLCAVGRCPPTEGGFQRQASHWCRSGFSALPYGD